MDQDNSTSSSTQERIQQVYRRHVLNLLAPVGWSATMLLPLLIVIVLMNTLGYIDEPLVRASLWLMGGTYLIFVLSFMMMQWIIWYLDIWILTNSRLVDTQLISLFNRKISQVPLNQVQDVRVDIKGYLPAIFRYGNVTVQSAGKEGFFQLNSISAPRDAARQILELCDSYGSSASNATSKVIKPTQTLGEILISQNKISHSDLTTVLNEQRQDGRQVGKILLEKNLISREDLVEALGSQYHIPSIDLSRYEIDSKIINNVSYDMATKYTIIPISQSPEALTIAIAHPSPEVIGELAAQMDIPLAFMVADEDYIKEAIHGYYDSSNMTPPSDEDPTTLEDLGLV